MFLDFEEQSFAIYFTLFNKINYLIIFIFLRGKMKYHIKFDKKIIVHGSIYWVNDLR
jgi:hypothetical protein